MSFCYNTRWRSRKIHLTPCAFRLQGMGESPSSPLPTPAACCCRLPWPNVRPPPPAQTARHTPLAFAAARRRRMAHTPANLTSTQGTNQSINQSIKPAIVLLIGPSRKKGMNYPIKRPASTADHREPHYNAHLILCIYPYVHMYMCTAAFLLHITYIYIYINNQLFFHTHHCRPIPLLHN